MSKVRRSMIDYRHVHHEARHIVSVGSFTRLQSEWKSQICQHFTVAHTEFSRREGRGGNNLLFRPVFPQNCVKIKKNWTKKGCIAGAPLINYGQPLFKKLLTMKGRWPHKMVTNGTRHSAKRWMEWPQIRAFTVVHLYITAVPSLWFLPNRANHIRFKVQTRLWLTILLEGHFPLRQKT